MDALVVFAPWAQLIVLGWKPLEFRGWDYTSRYPHLLNRRIVICSAARPIKLPEVKDLIDRIQGDEKSSVKPEALPLLQKIMAAHKGQGVVELGAGIGTAIIGRPRRVDALFKKPDSDRIHQHMYGWPMLEPKPFPEPIKAKGSQGFFIFGARVPQEWL